MRCSKTRSVLFKTDDKVIVNITMIWLFFFSDQFNNEHRWKKTNKKSITKYSGVLEDRKINVHNEHLDVKLRRLDIQLVDFMPFSPRETAFVISRLLSCASNPF